MKCYTVLQIVMCIIITNSKLTNALSSDEITEITDTCCAHAESFTSKASSAQECAGNPPPDEFEGEERVECVKAMKGCCDQYFQQKSECSAGMRLAPAKRCSVPKTDAGKTCCEECSFGILTGESQGREACGGPAADYMSPSSAMRRNAYYQCCVEAANKPTTTEKVTTSTTTEKRIETTTKKRESCRLKSCDHLCNDEGGKVICQCRDGYRLQKDRKSCKDINECAEALDDLCTTEGTVCHNTPGGFKCVPVKKRDTGLSCPPGFKRNVLNQVCDDINECQLPRPPCPKYLCENTIGGYKCGGKPGKPFEETARATEAPVAAEDPKNDMCPQGFRAGPDDDCLDIDECEAHLDDCQRLSQYCINTNGGFFCQDHVSRRCAPGFKVHPTTGVCGDIDECEETPDLCKRTEVCVNLPGAYTCKSKISTLPKLTTKTCQEGTRVRQGGPGCEDIDECREGTHLCDQFQNCINTFGAHECRCKNGFELDPSGSCVDIDECGLKLDNCRDGTYCINVLGTFTCTRQRPTTSTSTAPPVYDYEYYDDDNTTSEVPAPLPSTTTTHRPTTASTTRTNTPTTARTATLKPRTTTSTTERRTPSTTIPPPPSLPPRPYHSPTTSRTPFTSRPRPTAYSPFRPTSAPERPTSPPERPNYTPDRPTSRPDGPYNRSDRPSTPDRPNYTPERPSPDRPTSRSERPISPTGRPYYRPERPTSTERPRTEVPVTPRRPLRPEEMDFPTPKDPVTVERKKDPEGSYGIDTSDIPKDRWTNVVGRDSRTTTEKSRDDFDLNQLHCLNGFERNDQGECVDINECTGNHHLCNSMETCVNKQGGYTCECISGHGRDETGWCVPSAVSPAPDTAHTPASRPSERERPRAPLNCELGYTFDDITYSCLDIDECITDKHSCSPTEDCVNHSGGYRCACGARCQGTDVQPGYAPRHVEPDPTVITVGSQYGQRGPLRVRPAYSRQADNGAVSIRCPWGYRLTRDRVHRDPMCEDIDECANKSSECGPQQRCENFFGGYSCQCPAGHRLKGQGGCEDIDECRYGNPCPYNAQCVNTEGSYRCACGEGFRNAPSNEKVCVDIDECTDTPSVCEKGCANAWGSFRCYCPRGYRLHSDNRTCVDIDECSEWAGSRARGRLCGGTCVNSRGSYRCDCPGGYRLAEDGRSCIDIDECETGEATCARGAAGEVCQNTRGGYHCHHIDCPRGYRLEDKHRCSRIQRSCPVNEWSCLEQPSSYSYNFITFVANIYLPQGSVDLFTMHGPAWSDAVVTFELRMVDVKASPGVQPADLSCFDMRPSHNICVISLVCSLPGPQVAELELSMSLRQRGQFAGSAVARLVVIVSQYDF